MSMRRHSADDRKRRCWLIFCTRLKRAVPSLVGICDGKIVAHVMFSAMTMELARVGLSVSGLGPIGVRPEYQRRGIGSDLIWETVE